MSVFIGVALFSIHCTDAAGPDRKAPVPLAATAASGSSGIQLDQQNGTMGTLANPLVIIKGFNPTNPHVGDAIIATFVWFGTPGGVTGNIIESVTDVLTSPGYPPVGNKYDLVEFVTNGDISMATYVATNVQNFPDAGTDPGQILAVKADLRVPVTDAGVLLSAWIGVSVSPEALGEHRSASGTATPSLLTGATSAAPGAISVNPGALAYGVSLVSPPAGFDGPVGWTSISSSGSDLVMKDDGEYDERFTVSTSGGSANPTWNWYFTGPGSWLATGLALNPLPTTGSLTVTTSTSGENVPTSDYTVTLDGSATQPIPTNGNITFSSLQPGNHEVALSGLPANCQLTSANPVTVTVVAGETATAAFTVQCSAPPPPPPPPAPPNDFVTGGGKLRDGREFATFGLEASPSGGKLEWVQHCTDGPNPASALCGRGKFTFHGTVAPGSYMQASRGPNCRTWTGSGTSKEIGARNFTVQQGCDGGEPGRGVDYLDITIDDYQNSGYLTGGNIQLHNRRKS